MSVERVSPQGLAKAPIHVMEEMRRDCDPGSLLDLWSNWGLDFMLLSSGWHVSDIKENSYIAVGLFFPARNKF